MHHITVAYRLKPDDQDQLVQLMNHPKAVKYVLADVLSDDLGERYFCVRCGKRVNYLDPYSIHTCTPPADTRTDWSAA